MKNRYLRVSFTIVMASTACFIAHSQAANPPETTNSSEAAKTVTIKPAANGMGLHLEASGNLPLDDAIIFGNYEYGFDSSIESAPTVRQDEIKDGVPEWHRNNPDDKEGYFAKEVPFTADLPIGEKLKPTQKEFLERIVKAYNDTGSPGTYVIEGDEVNGYTVVGRSYRNASGEVVPSPMPLDCVVSLDIGPRPLNEAMGILVQEIARRCHFDNLNADFGDTFPGAPHDNLVSGSFREIPARQVLRKLMLQENRKLFYVAGFDPAINRYGLWVEPSFHRNEYGGYAPETR